VMPGIGDGLVPGPGPFVVGDHLAVSGVVSPGVPRACEPAQFLSGAKGIYLLLSK
jgi:hypothetical protein